MDLIQVLVLGDDLEQLALENIVYWYGSVLCLGIEVCCVLVWKCVVFLYGSVLCIGMEVYWYGSVLCIGIEVCCVLVLKCVVYWYGSFLEGEVEECGDDDDDGRMLMVLLGVQWLGHRWVHCHLLDMSLFLSPPLFTEGSELCSNHQ